MQPTLRAHGSARSHKESQSWVSCEALRAAGAAFLMWELSTPFVYMRWFLFTLGKAESKAYIINGLLMVGTFFVARNVFGTCGCSPF